MLWLLLVLLAQDLTVRGGLEIWRGNERLYRGPVKRMVPGTREVDELTGFHDVRLAKDGATIYFLAALGVEQQALCRVRQGGEGEYLVPAVDYALVEQGRYAGWVLVAQRAFAKAGRGKPLRPTFAIMLLGPDGKLGKKAGAEGEALSSVRERLEAMK